jgi:multidrug efflux system outer membrane protein
VNMTAALGVAVLACLLSACNFAPRYATPPVPTPAAFKEAGDWVVATPHDELPREHWWEVFNDPELNNLEEAVAQFDQARADAKAARADEYPTIDATGSASRTGLSRRTANPLPNDTYNNYGVGLDLQYEIDAWGRVRNEVKAANATVKASAGDLAAVTLSLHAELAADYFTLRGYDEEQDILNRTAQDYQEALDLTEARFKVGYAAKPAVSAAQAQLESARTQATETSLRRTNLEHAIAVLTGQPPEGFSLPARPLNVTPPDIATSLPAELLERRPDIAAAERRAAAANAEIGVARAVYFPTLNLNALFGVAATLPSNVFTAPAEAWSFGPAALLNVFDGGRRDALNKRARASYDQAVAQYRQTVLNAYNEVEDNLASLRLLAQEATTQQAAVTAATDSTTQATNLYSGGLDTYYDVILAQNIELSARLADADIRIRRMTAGVLLIKALGGGWQQDSSASTARLSRNMP